MSEVASEPTIASDSRNAPNGYDRGDEFDSNLSNIQNSITDSISGPKNEAKGAEATEPDAGTDIGDAGPPRSQHRNWSNRRRRRGGGARGRFNRLRNPNLGNFGIGSERADDNWYCEDDAENYRFDIQRKIHLEGAAFRVTVVNNKCLKKTTSPAAAAPDSAPSKEAEPSGPVADTAGTDGDMAVAPPPADSEEIAAKRLRNRIRRYAAPQFRRFFVHGIRLNRMLHQVSGVTGSTRPQTIGGLSSCNNDEAQQARNNKYGRNNRRRRYQPRANHAESMNETEEADENVEGVAPGSGGHRGRPSMSSRRRREHRSGNTCEGNQSEHPAAEMTDEACAAGGVDVQQGGSNARGGGGTFRGRWRGRGGWRRGAGWRGGRRGQATGANDKADSPEASKNEGSSEIITNVDAYQPVDHLHDNSSDSETHKNEGESH